MVDENKKVVLSFFEAVSERRLEDLPRFMARDVVDHNKIIHGEADWERGSVASKRPAGRDRSTAAPSASVRLWLGPACQVSGW
ncbi:hypothetical protein [Streptomyces sp. CA-106131]|uniref:hypothetical protein n=1 Tax=Streptomyces sp. CA-106131 TaxID=3240045 RepID=UPI003D937BF3